jgi:hypothetical protein
MEGDISITVDDYSRLARWTHWQGHGRNRPLSGFGSQGSHPSLFVADEVMVHASEKDLIKELIQKHGAMAMPSPEIPAPQGNFNLGARSSKHQSPCPCC